ncbi:MAG: GDP-mannose 4,6-dehydratase [Patescibacteria group bacterium]|jgi:GDPmannose 4,6-dehydratase
MAKIALITGILGQDGPYLARLLLNKGYQVFGLVQNLAAADFSNTDYLSITQQIKFVPGDLGEASTLTAAIKEIKPDEVYNLAAKSFVGSSWDGAEEATKVNSLGALYLLQALKEFCPTARFYQAATSEMFGTANEGGLQTEETPFHPLSPYAISKLYAYWITNNFKESYGLFCSNGIMFNHESPLRGLRFVTRKISDGVARIKLGLASEIRLGNLDSRRDWGFAGDYVEAMWLMLQAEKPDNYLISTGETHSIRDFLATAFAAVGISDWEPYIKIDEKFKRPVDVAVLQGRSDKARQVLGWTPKVKFAELVKMMVAADLERIANSE